MHIWLLSVYLGHLLSLCNLCISNFVSWLDTVWLPSYPLPTANILLVFSLSLISSLNHGWNHVGNAGPSLSCCIVCLILLSLFEIIFLPIIIKQNYIVGILSGMKVGMQSLFGLSAVFGVIYLRPRIVYAMDGEEKWFLTPWIPNDQWLLISCYFLVLLLNVDACLFQKSNILNLLFCRFWHFGRRSSCRVSESYRCRRRSWGCLDIG